MTIPLAIRPDSSCAPDPTPWPEVDIKRRAHKETLAEVESARREELDAVMIAQRKARAFTLFVTSTMIVAIILLTLMVMASSLMVMASSLMVMASALMVMASAPMVLATST